MGNKLKNSPCYSPPHSSKIQAGGLFKKSIMTEQERQAVYRIYLEVICDYNNGEIINKKTIKKLAKLIYPDADIRNNRSKEI